MTYLFVIGRILLGGYFLMSGYNHLKNTKMLSSYAESKKVPMPSTMVFVTGLMLIVGGFGIFLGVWVRFAIFLVSIFLAVVSFKMHDYWNIKDPMQKMTQEVNFKKNLALLGAVLMLLAISVPWPVALF